MSTSAEYRNALPKGYQLNEEYQIQSILGHGGFGITYLASDIKLKTTVAIKEYLPNGLTVRENHSVQPKSSHDVHDFKWGLKRFLQEAQVLARFHHYNIVRVRRFFEANNTAYIVMDYEKGRSLAEALQENETATEEELMKLLPPLLDGLKKVHQAEYLHRDIKPANIYLRDSDNSPVLMDFGAARQDLSTRSRSMTSIVTPGYAPFEQYQSKGKQQGAWTDIYALGAVLYRTIGGTTPIEATERINAMVNNRPDPLKPALKIGSSKYSKHLLEGIDFALKVREIERPQNIAQWETVMLPQSQPFTPSKPHLTRFFQLKKWATTFLIFLIGLIIISISGMLTFGIWPYLKSAHSPPIEETQPDSQQVLREIEKETKAGWTPSGEFFQDPLQIGGFGPQMVIIPGGSFNMGDLQGNDNIDEQSVEIWVEDFAIGRYEVTFEEYDRFTEATGREKADDMGWGRSNHPVMNVSWYDAAAYADWLKQQTGKPYRLPTEAEWEYATRANTKTKYWWGNDIGKNQAACDGCGAKWGWDAQNMTAPIGSFEPNPFGLYDTVGNVWEWVCSEYEEEYRGKEQYCLNINDVHAGTRLVMRGGSWISTPMDVRSARRNWWWPDRVKDAGLRIAMDVID